MQSSVLLSVYYQSKNYIGINRIMTFTFGEFMGKCVMCYMILMCYVPIKHKWLIVLPYTLIMRYFTFI